MLAARLVGIFGLIILGFAVVPALAHAVLIESSIGSKPVPAETAVTVTMRFNAELEQSFFRVTLIGPGKKSRELKTAPGKARFEQIVELPPLEPGKYALRYTVLAADSHLTEAVLRFTVEAAK